MTRLSSLPAAGLIRASTCMTHNFYSCLASHRGHRCQRQWQLAAATSTITSVTAAQRAASAGMQRSSMAFASAATKATKLGCIALHSGACRRASMGSVHSDCMVLMYAGLGLFFRGCTRISVLHSSSCFSLARANNRNAPGR